MYTIHSPKRYYTLFCSVLHELGMYFVGFEVSLIGKNLTYEERGFIIFQIAIGSQGGGRMAFFLCFPLTVF